MSPQNLFREDRVDWPVQLLRSRASSGLSGATEKAELAVRLVADADNRECLFSYLEQAQDRLVITSDKVTAREDPLLCEKLLQTARSLVAHCRLTIRFNAVDGDRTPLLDGLKDAGAAIVEDGKNHTKVPLRVVASRRRAIDSLGQRYRYRSATTTGGPNL